MAAKSTTPKKHRPDAVMMASFPRRAVAFGLDFSLLVSLVAFLAIFFEQIDPSRILSDSGWRFADQLVDFLHDQTAGMRFVAAMMVGLGCLLGALTDSMARGSLGKRLLGLRVVDRHGEPIAIAQALWRNAWKVALLIPMGLGSWWAGFDSMHRALHDRLAGTWVIRAETQAGWAEDAGD